LPKAHGNRNVAQMLLFLWDVVFIVINFFSLRLQHQILLSIVLLLAMKPHYLNLDFWEKTRFYLFILSIIFVIP
jgi:hypothetical protein